MLDPLTEREQEILLLMSRGMSNKDIAGSLYLSSGTIKAHNHNIFSKLGVSNRTQAVLKAEALGLLNSTPDSHPQNGNLPTQLTPFVGRKAEFVRLQAMIDDERIRLITILSTGGMGKTRLAIELAHHVAPEFPDGTFFVSLAHISDTEKLATAIIDELGLRFQASEQPEKQLLTFLSDKHLLLVLDNFEHLLDGADLLTEILSTTPGIKLLVTSRERLNLSPEVVFVLGGLGYVDSADAFTQNEAVQFLLERARFINPAFALQPDDWPHVRHICRLTDGMPLALVLAAGWLDTLTLDEIARELSQSIDFLESQLHDLPARQRSMRASITSSWKRLTPEEQCVFASLSVFRGGFTREAARIIADTTLRHLQTLVNRSFITFHDGRYEMHELLRQFAETELRDHPEQHQRIHDLHCDYYMDFLNERLKEVQYARKHLILQEIKRNLDNIWAAWHWAVEHIKIDSMQQATQTMALFWHTQGRYREGIEIFGRSVQTLSKAPPGEQRDLLIAIMSTDLGWYHIRLGKLDEAEAFFKSGHTLFEQLGFPFLVTTTDPLVGLAFIASIRGSYDEAAHIAERALHQNEIQHHSSNQAYALYALTGIKLAQGHYEQAQNYGLRAVATADNNNMGDRWLAAYCLLELGNVARAMGDYTTARRYYEECYAIKEDFDDPEGMAVVLNHLGQLALRQSNFTEAERLYRQSQQIYGEIMDRGGLATALHGLGQVAFANGHYPACCDYLLQALQTASEIEFLPLLFAVLLTTVELWLQTGQTEQALGLLTFVRQHPASSQETKNQAEEIFAGYTGPIPDPTAGDLLSVVGRVHTALLRGT